ncbi:MAG: transposase [Deltaproteobacteria bacterium]|nr:transposase [Deltaproteobacteria bacterium]
MVYGRSRAAKYAAKGVRPLPAPSTLILGGSSTTTTKEEQLRTAIHEIVDGHPAWGVRKVWATLRRKPRELIAGKRRVDELMKDMGLCLDAERKEREAAARGHVAVKQPNRRIAADLTTVTTKEDGLVAIAIAIVIDCGSRSMLEVGVTKSQESTPILAPVRAALAEAFGAPENGPEGFELLIDHGPQYTGSDAADLCDEWNVERIFSAVGQPTGNAVAERVIRTMKEECIWLRDWSSAAELQQALNLWKASYNDERPHQALAWQTPSERRTARLSVRRAA